MKFKNIKKKSPPAGGNNTKFPSNSRSITENFKSSFPKINHATLFKIYGGALRLFVVLIFAVAVVVVGYDLQKNLQTKQNIDQQRESLNKDLNFWISFLAKHQNYPDAYFQAAVLEYKLRDSSKAKMYLEKGLSLDPNSENGRKIKEFLKNKLYF